MIIYLCENCREFHWTKTTLSEHQINQHILRDKFSKEQLLWRRYDIIVKNKSSLKRGMGFDKSIKYIYRHHFCGGVESFKKICDECKKQQEKN